MKTLLGILAVLVLAGFILHSSIKAEEEDIHQWAEMKGVKVKNIETHLTRIGTPFFYCNRGSRIYEVDLNNGEKWWVRTGIFSNDYLKDE